MDANPPKIVDAEPGAESLGWWDGRSALDPLAAVLDPSDEAGVKNAHIHALHARAMARFGGFGPGDRVLDFGCGNGRMTPVLAARAEWVSGVDISPELVRSAGELRDCENCEFLVYDGGRLPFDDAVFDGVATAVVLQMFCATPERFREVVGEIVRTLRPGARVRMIERISPADTEDGWAEPRWRSELAACGIELERHRPVRHGAPTRIASAVEKGRVPDRFLPLAASLDLALTNGGVARVPYSESLIEARRV